MNFRKFFHYVSYLQYPFMLLGLYFAIHPYLSGVEELKGNPDRLFESLNTVLIFMGLGVSFSSLQDTTKVQNEISRKIWEHPLKGKIFIIMISFLILFLLVTGLLAYFKAGNGPLKNLSVGIIVLGLGMFGLLKTAIEMFENHRTDKNTTTGKVNKDSGNHA